MKKLTKEQIKEALLKRPSELSKEELSFLFYIFCFNIKEYYSGEHNISFEIHFERTFIIRVNYPKEKGAMSLDNEFLNIADGCHGIATPRAKDTGELIRFFVNMFYDSLLSSANYTVTYNEDESLFNSKEEATEYLKFVQDLL